MLSAQTDAIASKHWREYACRPTNILHDTACSCQAEGPRCSSQKTLKTDCFRMFNIRHSVVRPHHSAQKCLC